MSEKNNGGPAFPVDTGSTGDTESGEFGHQTGNTTWQFSGMTLRDYAAIKMMAALAADAKRGPDTLYMNYEVAARESYAIADAMLAERAK